MQLSFEVHRHIPISLVALEIFGGIGAFAQGPTGPVTILHEQVT